MGRPEGSAPCSFAGVTRFAQPPVSTHWTPTGHLLDIHWTSMGHPLDTHWKSTGHPLDTHWTILAKLSKPSDRWKGAWGAESSRFIVHLLPGCKGLQRLPGAGAELLQEPLGSQTHPSERLHHVSQVQRTVVLRVRSDLLSLLLVTLDMVFFVS